MAVKVRLGDGAEFVLHTTVEDLQKGIRLALDNNQLLEVENGNGKMRVLNPSQIVFFEEVPEDTPEDESPHLRHAVG